MFLKLTKLVEVNDDEYEAHECDKILINMNFVHYIDSEVREIFNKGKECSSISLSVEYIYNKEKIILVKETIEEIQVMLNCGQNNP